MKTENDLYREIDMHIIREDKPSLYLNKIYDNLRAYPFNMLYKLKKTPQSKKHHPEGDVWVHTMLVLDEAAKFKHKSQNKRAFMWAALLHDIGKPSTTKIKGDKITAYNHDKVGAKLAREFLSFFKVDTGFINEVSNLVLYHMHILYIVNDLPFSDIKGLLQNTTISEVALIGLCDRLGRGNVNRLREEENINKFILKLQGSGKGLPI